MDQTRLFVPCFLLIASTACYGFAQTPGESSSKKTATTEVITGVQPITILLVGGGKMLVDEVNEESDGYWYKRGNISTFIDRAKVEQIKRPLIEAEQNAKTPVQSNIRWRLTDAAKVKDFFQTTFNRPLPLSSFGQSEIHNRWGLDHRNGMDVNLHPDSPEGRALIDCLRSESIPFLTFRSAIPGVATGPHIHVGNPSPRVSIH
jgi:hypothetical protein